MKGAQMMDVLEKIKSSGVRFVRLQFTDVNGVLKNVAIPPVRQKAWKGN